METEDFGLAPKGPYNVRTGGTWHKLPNGPGQEEAGRTTGGRDVVRGGDVEGECSGDWTDGQLVDKVGKQTWWWFSTASLCGFDEIFGIGKISYHCLP